MSSLLALARATYRGIVTKPVYYVTLAIFAAAIFGSQYIALFAFYKETDLVREMGVASITLWALILVSTLTGVLVTSELEDRTAIMLLSKPLKRSHFLVGKFLGLTASLFMGVIFLTTILFLTLWLQNGIKWMQGYSAAEKSSAWEYLCEKFINANGRFCLQGAILCFFQATILAAVCVSLSAFFPVVVSVSTTALVFILGNLSNYVIATTKSGGWAAKGSAKMFAYVLPNFGYFNLQTVFSEGRAVSAKYLFFLGGYTIMLVSLVLYLAATIFEKREIR